jgi:hypothetical protein
VTIEATGGKTFSGRVESIGVLAESGGWRDPNLREYTVKIALDGDHESELKPSMRCEARLTLGRVEDALAVPIQAVFNDGAVRYVYTPRGSKFERVPVKVGRRSETHAEILAGIEASEVVLVRQPEPGEVISAPWTDAMLQPVGLRLADDGSAVPIRGAGGGPESGPGVGDARRPAGRGGVSRAGGGGSERG